MLESIAIIVLSSLILGSVFKKLRLPPLLAMLTIGIVFGPYVLDLLDDKLLDISYELRQVALIIILTRAGLSLNVSQLKSIGRPALLMSFVPALCEIAAYVLFATLIIGVSATDALLIGSVMAAISPAVVVPKMLKLKELGYDSVSKVPSIITASSSVDDVFVIVLFTAFVAMAGGEGFNLNVLWQIPVSILSGIAVGVVLGKIFVWIFDKLKLQNTIKVLVLLCVSMGLLWVENYLASVPYSALLSIISLAVIINSNNPETTKPLSDKYAKLWIFAEIMLFALIGAEVDISYALNNGVLIVLVILICLMFRMLGVFLALLGSGIDSKQRVFCAIAYTPKATVQAAIGGVALAMALPIGQTVLSFAVIGILVTAPLGAFLIDVSYKKLLPPLL